MPTTYPADKTWWMGHDGPEDKRFAVDGGCLVYDEHHDERFPYLWSSLRWHPLVHDTVAVKRILIYIVDTDPAALKCRAVLHCHMYEAQDSMTHERFPIVGSGKCSCVIGIYDEPVTINSPHASMAVNDPPLSFLPSPTFLNLSSYASLPFVLSHQV